MKHRLSVSVDEETAFMEKVTQDLSTKGSIFHGHKSPIQQQLESEGYFFMGNYEKHIEPEIFSSLANQVPIRTAPACDSDGRLLIDMIGLYIKGNQKEAEIVWDWYLKESILNPSSKAIFEGNVDDLVVVGMGEIGITRASDKKPIIGTAGLGLCIGVLGYEPEQKIAFVGHMTSRIDIDRTAGKILYNLHEQGNLPHNYKLRLVGGQDITQKRGVEGLVGRLNVREDMDFEVVEKDLYGGDKIRSIGIDTREGTLYKFKKLNCIGQGFGIITAPLKLIYIPKN